jgi:putative protease
LKKSVRITAESGIDVEAFVHGAMCIAYSGRCLLSGYMNNRESNRGMCCQPCRFHYTLMEQTRPGQYFPIAEDPRGAYLFNSRDLCMIEHLPQG